MAEERDRVLTPRFFLMCGFTFTVFFSAMMLLPTAPFRILGLGGTKVAAGLFLGFLTYASAISAPLTGALADRVGKRRMLLTCSLVIAGFSLAYGLSGSYRLLLVLVPIHGLFWSGLLSASAAYMTDMIPPSRRAEGISYWGMSSILALALAPNAGFWMYRHGWAWLCGLCVALNLVMATIAFTLPEARVAPPAHARFFRRGLLEWRVLAVSLTLFLYSFGYGGVMSFVALYADASGTSPKGIFFTVLAAVMLIARPFVARFADDVGHRRVFLPSLGFIVAGLALLTVAGTKPWLIASALVFGLGFGSAYPVYVAYLMTFVDPARRGAAFGAILAAFDIGVGTGSITVGWLIQRFGFARAFGTAATLSALALPYFLFAERRLLRREPAPLPSALREGTDLPEQT